MMDKPFSIQLRETKNQIIGILNASELHIDIIRYVLTDILTTVNLQAEQSYAEDLNSYEEDTDVIN